MQHWMHKITESSAPLLWTPADVSTDLWFDASDASTITETAGAVSQWDDKSGNDCHAVQATGISQPITNSRTINGLNVLDFDGSDDDMSMAAGPQADSAQTIMIAVADFDSPFNVNGQRLIQFQSGGATRWALMVQGAVGDQAQYTNSSSFTGPLETITTSTHLISGYRDGTTVGVGVDGVYVTDLSGANATVDSWTIGSRASGAGDFLDGGFAEAVVLKSYNLGLIQKLEGYLAWKWGLEANLPIGHPYKSAAPTA